MYKLRCYTGPSGVDRIADKLAEVGFEVTARGTAHVYVTLHGHDNPDFLRSDVADLFIGLCDEKLGLHFGWDWRDINVTREGEEDCTLGVKA